MLQRTEKVNVCHWDSQKKDEKPIEKKMISGIIDNVKAFTLSDENGGSENGREKD